MNEALDMIAGRCVLRIERSFRHPIEKVWRAITDPDQLRHWFPSEVTMDLRVGGSIRFMAHKGPELEGRILELDRPRLFTFSWGDSQLRFELQPADGPGCRMLFSHTFDDRVSAASYAAGWQICFGNLYLLLDAKAPDVGLDQWAAMHDGYVKQFGLDSGTVVEGAGPGGGWEVRFARQLTRPVDEVWSVLAGGQEPEIGGVVPAGFTGGQAIGGSVSAAEPPRLLEYTWPGGRVRWALSSGNGGARLDLTEWIPGDGPDRVQAALSAWADALKSLADGLRERLTAAPRR